MSATVDFTTVTNAIEALSISGVTITDVDEVTDSLKMTTRTLTPRAKDFITDITITRDEFSGQKLRLRYTLNYIYIHCAIGGGTGGLLASYKGLIDNAAAILLALSNDATLAGSVDNDYPVMPVFGAVGDPTGNMFYGCEFAIPILQFLEV